MALRIMQGKIRSYLLALHSCPLLSTASCTSHSWFSQIVSNQLAQKSRVSCNGCGVFHHQLPGQTHCKTVCQSPYSIKRIGTQCSEVYAGCSEGAVPRSAWPGRAAGPGRPGSPPGCRHPPLHPPLHLLYSCWHSCTASPGMMPCSDQNAHPYTLVLTCACAYTNVLRCLCVCEPLGQS